MTVTTRTQTLVAQWLDETLHPAYADQARERIETAVDNAITPFIRDGVASVPLAPGNGWTYDMVLVRLRDADADRFGGNILVTIPIQRACMVINAPAFLVPNYVAEKLGDQFTRADATIVAAFLTLFSEAIATYLD